MLIWIGLLYLTGQVLSDPDVHLSLGGTRINNNSYVDIDSIGTSSSDTDSLLCHTGGRDGGWYYRNNSTIVLNTSVANNARAFVSNKNMTVVKLFRTNTSESIIGGQFYCMVNEILVYYINIVDIIALSTSPNGSTLEISQDTFSLNCSIDLILPRDTPAPNLVWFFNLSNSLLPDGVMMSNTSRIDNNTYTSTLHFSPLRESQMGTYVCQIEGNNRQSTNTSITIISLQISDGDISPVIGLSYNLTCDVSINVSSYRWRKNSEVISEKVNKVLEFNSLHLSNVGNYTCEVVIGSRNYTAINHKPIILEIPAPLVSVMVISNQTNPTWPVGDNITLICVVELSPEVDIPVIVNTIWRGPAGFMENVTANAESHTANTSYSSTVTISFFKNIHSGDYNCTAEVMAAEGSLSQYLNDSTRIVSNETRITTGVYLFLNGEALQNNSFLIPVGDGKTSESETSKASDDGDSESESDSSTVYVFPVCHTDKYRCCNTSNEGEWSLPTNTTKGVASKFTVIRNNQGAIQLVYGDSNPPPQGLYCCTVPDADNTDQTICVNTAPTISIDETNRTLGESYNLTCSAPGLPDPTFMWEKDKIPLSGKTESTLTFTPLSLSDGGRYTCIVNNTYSENREVTITVPAPTFVMLVSDKSNPIWPNGLNVTLTCTVKLNNYSIANLSMIMVNASFSKFNTSLTLSSYKMVDNTTFEYTKQLNLFQRNDSGNYSCKVVVSPRFRLNHIVNSTTTKIMKISTGVYLFLNRTIITNNSKIQNNATGEGNDEALLCYTDLHLFLPDADEMGQWYYPNGMLVEMNETISDIYTSRSQGVVRLHRKENAIMPSGLFHCKIPDSTLMNKSIYVSVLSLPIHQNKTKETNTPSTLPAVAAGAGVFGLLLVIAGFVLAILAMKRLRARKNKLHDNFRGFSESLEAIDSTNLPPEPDMAEDKGECIELNEYDEVQADEDDDRNFTDTTPAEGECIKSIPLSEFCNHVEQMHADRDKLFEMEYTRLSRLPKFCTSEAKLSHNMPKNRFANILPYDCSRVKLTEIEGEQGSDYINANYLDGYNKPNAYIAAQGPLPNTVCDFWRMVWEKKLSTIAMLTRCFEGRPKCEEYWPVNVGESIQPGHNLTITLKAMLPFAEYSVRKMTVKCVQPPEGCEGSSNTDSSSSLEVVQFHFTGWPDHGVPQNGVVLVNFIWRIRTIHPYSDPCPLLVHCSAGVGRTGAFIVLDSMLERIKEEEDHLNIFEFLKQLRAQRVLMVQTQAQYNFIHDVLNELILTGNTEITAPNFRIIMNRLNKVIDGESGYSKQFKILDQVSPTPREFDCTQADMEFNAEKNRYPHIKPNDRHRVMLREEVGSGQDYINASFINGYRQRGTYIATQVPMENTVNDFWKMIWEYKSTTIVLLCKMTEGEVYPDFLPDSKGGCMMYGKVEVKFVSQQVSPDYVVKHLELSEVKGADTLDTMTITLFHYLRWPKNGSPQRSASLLEIIELVNKKQMGSGNKAITVICNDGVGRTGAFICIHTQMERMKTEGVVDFFQCIKSARIQRAGLVPDVDQYVLCHTVVADYLNDFDAYANFKDLI